MSGGGGVEDHVILNAETGQEKALCIFHVLDEDDSGYLELARPRPPLPLHSRLLTFLVRVVEGPL